MSQPSKSNSKNILKTAVSAAASIGLYLAVFSNEALVTEMFTKGGYYAAFPVATALVFSFVHGAFASNFLETLGITAKKSPAIEISVSQEKQSGVKKDTRPRLQA